jgi:hypothetical protein
MASVLVRLSALLISMLIFWIAWSETKNQISFFCGGCFFLVLFIATFFKEKYLIIFFGIFAIFPIWIGLIDGVVFGFGRAASNYSLVHYPLGYWLTMGLWLCAIIGGFTYGIYKAFVAKPSKIEDGK